MASGMKSLPDYLRPGLDLVFVGINPGMSSLDAGRYFFNPRNRFWSAFNAAGLTAEPLSPDKDFKALVYGIGFTDLAKRATRQMSELRAADFKEGAKVLRSKLLEHQPLAVCFNGLTGYKKYLLYTGGDHRSVQLGKQTQSIGDSCVYVIPSTSPANAAVNLERIVDGMTDLKGLVRSLKKSGSDE